MDTFYLKRWENPITLSVFGLILGCSLKKCSTPITLSAVRDTVLLTEVGFASTYLAITLGFLVPGFLVLILSAMLLRVEVFTGSMGLDVRAIFFALKGYIDI